MAKIPTYGLDLVDEAPLPGARQTMQATPEMFFNDGGAGALGKGLVKAGDAILDIQARIRKDEIETKVRERDVMMSDQLRAILHDPEKGYLLSKNKAAYDGRENVVKAIEDIGVKAMEGVTDPIEQRALSRLWNSHRTSALGQVDVHAGREFKTYQGALIQKRIDGYGQDMVLNRATEGRINPDTEAPVGPYAEARATMVDEVKNLARHNGITDEKVVDQMVRSTLTAAHKQVIDDILRGENPKRADSYFKKYSERGEIDPTEQAELRAKIDREVVDKEALHVARGLEAETKRNYGVALDRLGKMFDERKISSAAFKEAKVYLEHQRHESERLANKAEQDSLGKAYAWLDANPGKSHMEMPRSLYEANAKHIPALRSYSGRAELSGGDAIARFQQIVDDPEFMSKSTSELDAHRPELGSAMVARMVSIQNERKKESKSFKFNDDVLDTYVPKSIKSDKKQVEMFKGAATLALQDWKDQNPGKLPDKKEQEEIIRKANSDWIQLNKVMWNETKPAFKVMNQQDIKAVPVDYYNWAKQEAAKRNEKITDDQIYAGWLRQKAQKK